MKKITKQRQKEGIEKARLKGNYRNVGGKKPKLTIDQFFKKSKNLACLNELKKGNSIRKSAINSNLSAAQALIKAIKSTNKNQVRTIQEIHNA